jgi:hypothetical protein
VPACLQPFMGGKTFIPYNEKKTKLFFESKAKELEKEEKKTQKKGKGKEKKMKKRKNNDVLNYLDLIIQTILFTH